MLKGNIECKETKNLLLRYINFELPKKQTEQIARHLRNCPNCINEYSKLISRKKNLKEKMKAIEKRLKMELDISSYIDSELTLSAMQTVQNMFISDKNYKDELEETIKALYFIHNLQDKVDKELTFKNTNRIIAKLKAKKISKIRFKRNLAKLLT